MKFPMLGIVAMLFCSTVASAETAGEMLHTLFADERTTYYQENPGTAPRGEPRSIATRWTGNSRADIARRAAADTAFLARLHSIDRAALSPADKTSYDVFEFMLESRMTFARHRSWRMPLTSDSGFHTYIQRSWQFDNFKSAQDYAAYIARLKDTPRYLAEHQANLAVGVSEGWTMPRVVLDGLISTFETPLVENVEDSAFYGPFRNMHADIPQAEKAGLREEARAAIKDHVLPAYEALYTFMKDTYLPAARTDLAASNLPGGKDFYADMVRYYTTVDVTADEVHHIGLAEVARIRAEMEAIIADLQFEGSFADFLAFLRNDPQFYAKSEKELLMHASYIAKKIDGRMPSLFATLPRQPYGVEAVPAAIAPNYTTGRYRGAPLDAPVGGAYLVNTYALDKRPLYVLPALTLHEGVPGHHHQTALSKELRNVPEFRQDLYPHAFGEGWGLYSEKLGLDMGIYETPYEQFGRLTYEMWRACRLVIDTGIHAKGWTREEAIKLLAENSALSTHNIRTEVDRYISWPGQALAYKMGELTFLRLRREAKEALGSKFDIRAFHDTLLSDGGVPLHMVEAKIAAWIKESLAEN